MNKNASFTNKNASVSIKLKKQASIYKPANYGGASIADAQYHDFYSPVLSKDFLELPHNLKEKRSWYRFFYNNNELVRRAIDLHSELPLSKIRLQAPKSSDPDKSAYILTFFENMCERIKLFRKLLAIAHEYYLIGVVYIFLEDGSEKGPKNDPLFSIDSELSIPEEALKLRNQYDKKPDYQGWDNILIIPPDMVKVTKWQFTDRVKAELLVPDDTKNLIISGSFLERGTPIVVEDIIKDIPTEIKSKINDNSPIILDTDPFSGSHLAEICRKTGDYEATGSSILDACLRSLMQMDKYRQAQSQIASRHMTPMRVISAPKASFEDIEALREQVDAAMTDPDYSIIANYEINWQEMGSDSRILHLADEYQELEKRLSAGLGVTISLLTGEASYGGEKISLEIINTQYMLFREIMQDFVETHIFKPISLKKGFWEYDKFGNKKLLYPKLSFTRLAIRDNDAVFSQLYDLYQKGSIPLSYILDLLGLDAHSAKEEIEKDLLTVNDSRFNDILSALSNPIADALATNTDLPEKIAKYLNLNWRNPDVDSLNKERFQ